MKKQPKAATKALEALAGATLKAGPPEPAVAEKPREARSPRLSPSLKAQADRLIAARDKKKAPAAHGARPPKAKASETEEDLVVFAFRLSADERELIHKAAGPAKASRFVRALAVAAACHDEAAIKLLLQSAQQASA